MDIKTKQVLSAFLAIFSSAGVAGTAYLAVKSHDKAVKDGKDLKNTKAKFRAYAPAIAVGTATIASILASHFLSKKAEASLIASATLIDQGWRRYQYKVKDILGIDSHKKVIDAIAEECSSGVKAEDGKELYYVEPIGFFKARPEDLAWAYGDMNQRLHTIDTKRQTAYFCLLYDMLKDAKAEVLDKNLASDKENWGWSYSYLRDTNKPTWIHMNLTPKKLQDGREYTLIDFDEEPVYDPASGGSAYFDEVDDKSAESTYKKVTKLEDADNAKHNEND